VSAGLTVFLLVFVASGFEIGDWVCLRSGQNLLDAACGQKILWVSNGNERGHITALQQCGTPALAWYQVAMDDGGPIFWVADQNNKMIFDCGIPTGAVYIKDVPYVHQDWDVGDSFNGSWACGPTSSTMAMAYHKKISPKPITCSRPWVHNNSFGYYDSNVYTSPINITFNRMQPDAAGKPAWGAYGTCTEGGGAWAWRVQQYVENHGGLMATFYDQSDPTLLKTSIDAGNLVIQSTQMSSAGHLVLIVGYNPDGTFLVNDPAGNKNGPSWAMYPTGAYQSYSWTTLAPKWCIVVSVTTMKERAKPAPFNIASAFREQI